ncbi:MAG: PASTA domain-containing protein, partial [Deltaproteobacteria bacterium]|nr:PASTA domain-containing protein [Deltaproteobacteria bacterium]
MCDRSLTKRSLFFVSILFLLSSWITAFAAPLPCQFYGHLYVNGNLWTDGNPNYHITLDVVRIVNEQEVIVAQGGAEFFMSNAVQHTYTLSFSCDDADSDAIHSGDVCLIYVDGILSDTKPIVAIGWNNVDIYVTTEEQQIPNVAGMSQGAAESAITGAGFTVGSVTEECSDTVAAGNVISQD